MTRAVIVYVVVAHLVVKVVLVVNVVLVAKYLNWLTWQVQ